MYLKKQVAKFKGIQSKFIVDSNVIIDTCDPKSDNYRSSIQFLEIIVKDRISFAMPTHGYFEIRCNLDKIKDERGITNPFKEPFPIEFIHIDDKFLKKYKDIDIPITKAMDHIFLVVAKKNSIPLITWDKQMIRIGKSAHITMLTPIEWMEKYKQLYSTQ